MTEPVRPASVPADAVYNADSALWELAERDAQGLLHGAFSTFHTDGALVMRGSHHEGKLDGTVSRFTDGSAGSRPLRVCCVPPGARELRTRYRAGAFLDETFFDEHGRPLTDDGTPWPERAPGVPPTARYEPANGRYLERIEHGSERTTLRVFHPNGALEEAVEFTHGHARVHRHFAADASCREQTELDERGAWHGSFFAHFSADDARFTDARVRRISGCYEHGEPSGSFELRDHDGVLVCRVEYGAVFGATTPASVSGTAPSDAPAEPGAEAELLWRLATESERAPREAVALAARAFAKSGDRARFERFLNERTPALSHDHATELANHAVKPENAKPSALLGALVGGGAPAMLLRTLASALPGHAPAALDYFDASELLAPEQPLLGLGRGLLCIEHGDPAGALVAAERAERETSNAAEPLRQFTRVTYGDFSFRPARDGVARAQEGIAEVEATQPLEAIERTVELYATRLDTIRRELARRAGGTPSWLPPDTRELFCAGPLELGRYSTPIEDEGENGPEISNVDVDETLDLALSTRRLLTTAHADWAALCWLCWSTGLDSVARPERLVPRSDFAAAAHQAILRCWRAQDRLRTQGLVALARHVESFDWEGIPIDEVPPHLVEVVAAEYLEVRALFFWLLFPQNRSPFQADLRRA
jgi:hypothetical protein